MKLTITRQYNSNSIANSSIEFECLIFDSTILETRRLFHLTGDQIRELIFWMKKTAQNRKSQPLFCGFLFFIFLFSFNCRLCVLFIPLYANQPRTSPSSFFIISFSLFNRWAADCDELEFYSDGRPAQQRHDKYEIEKKFISLANSKSLNFSAILSWAQIIWQFCCFITTRKKIIKKRNRN